MSETLATAVQWVRELTKTADLARPPIDTPELKRLIIARSVMVGASLELGEDWTEDAITLVAGTSDYDLPTGVQYAEVLAFKLASNGWIIPIVSPHTLEARWRQGPEANYAAGDPQDAYLFEDASQVVNVRFGPIPNEADSVHIMTSSLPAMTLTDATVIPLSNLALQAIHFDVAALVIRRMTPQQLEQIELTPSVADRYEMDAREARLEDEQRVNAMKIVLVPSPWA